MPSRQFNRFSLGISGMNCNTSSLILADTDAELLRNCDIDDIGKISKRKGTLLYGSQIVANKTILGIYEFTSSGGTSYQLAVCSDGTNNDTYKITSTTLNGAITTSSTSIVLTSGTNFANSGTVEIEGDLITYTGKSTHTLTGVTGITDSHASGVTARQWIKTGLVDDTKDKKTRFSSLVDYVFRVNGAEAMSSSADTATWGTTNCLATLTPSLIENFQDRLYVAGDATNPDRLYASSIPSLTNVLTWNTTTQVIDSIGSAGFYIDINPDDSCGNLTALKTNGTNLLMFKDRALYTYNGSATQPDQLIDVGAVSQDVVQNIGYITFFFGRCEKELGVYAYTGGYPKLISRKIKRWIDNIDQTTYATWCAGVTNDKYMLYVGNVVFNNDEIYGTITFSDVWLVYNVSKDAWTVYDNLPARMFGYYTVSNARKLFYGNNNGKIFEVGSGETDDSGDSKTTLEQEFIGKEDVFDAPYYPKTLEDMLIYSTLAQNSSLKYRYNRGEWYNLGSLGGRTTLLTAPQKNSNFREGESIQLKLTNNTNRTSNIEGYVVNVNIGEEARGTKR